MSDLKTEFTAMPKDEKIARLRSYLAYLQSRDGDYENDFVDLLMMVKDLNECSSHYTGETFIISSASAINEEVFKKLEQATHYIDRPYYSQGYDSAASISAFEDDKTRNYTTMPVTSPVSIFTAVTMSTKEHDNANVSSIFNSGFLSMNPKGSVLDFVVYRIANVIMTPQGLYEITLLNEATGKTAKVTLPLDAAKFIIGY